MATSQIESQLQRNSVGPYKWAVLILTTLSQTSISYAGQGIGALAPILQQTFHLSNAQIGVATSANNIGIGLTALIFGGLVDRVGDKKIMVLSGMLTGLSILGASLSPNFWVLLILLVETGMWAGAATPAGSKAIVNYFLPAMRGMAMGIRQMGVAAGGFIAALTLPLIARGGNWSLAFIVAGIATIVSNIIYLIFYRGKKSSGNKSNGVAQAEDPSDRTGHVGTARDENDGLAVAHTTSLGADGAGAAGIGTDDDGGAGGVGADRMSDDGFAGKPRRRRRTLANRSVWFTSIAGTSLIGSQFVLIGYTQLFLHKEAAIPFRYTFYFLAMAQLAGMIGRVVLGIVSDRLFHSRRKPILLIVALLIASFAMAMLFITPSTPWWLIGVLFTAMGFVSMGWNGLWVTLVSELVDARQSSSALGAAMSLLQAGVLVYPVLFGIIVDAFHSYRVSWVFIACVVLAGWVVLTRVKERTTI